MSLVVPARPSRRAVARGAAWAIPVVTVGAAAPLAVASPCAPQSYTLDWGGGSGTAYTRTSATEGVAAVDPDGAGPILPVSLSIRSAFFGAMKAGNEAGTTNDNFRVSTGAVGGTGARAFTFQQSLTSSRNAGSPGRSARQEITFSFTPAVRNLKFIVTDIDSATRDFDDRIELTGSFTSTIVNTAAVGGAGTEASPFRPLTTNAGVDDATGTAGNVRIAYAGTVASFTIVYWNAVAQNPSNGIDRGQAVFVSGLTFDVVRTTC